MNLKYTIPRFVRHFLPEKLVRFLLLNNFIIKPGIETRNPDKAVARYRLDLEKEGIQIKDKNILIFGYGGRFDLATSLLRAGAAHITFVDKFAPPDDARNLDLRPLNERKKKKNRGRVIPRPEWITLIEQDICSEHARSAIPPVDILLSSSVYEHLDDVDGITKSLAKIIKPDGIQLHYIDLRDHFFKYPFEMLCYSEKNWYGWLNPSSNHNRFRIWDYRRVFEKYFEKVDIMVEEHDHKSFEKARLRIRPEFLSGNLDEDSVTKIKVVVWRAKK